jgi:hypothetical protein
MLGDQKIPGLSTQEMSATSEIGRKHVGGCSLSMGDQKIRVCQLKTYQQLKKLAESRWGGVRCRWGTRRSVFVNLRSVVNLTPGGGVSAIDGGPEDEH